LGLKNHLFRVVEILRQKGQFRRTEFRHVAP
jgi:hypothetical protein